MIQLVSIEEKETENAYVVPQPGDEIVWAIGVPAFSVATPFFLGEGVVLAVIHDPFDGWRVIARESNGRETAPGLAISS